MLTNFKEKKRPRRSLFGKKITQLHKMGRRNKKGTMYNPQITYKMLRYRGDIVSSEWYFNYF